ncbi:MAG TPA: response regulator [Noviherbaspirillum sp.]
MPETSKNTVTLQAAGDTSRESAAALAMGSLLTEMDHDIRTSMNGIVGMLELLCDTGLSGAQLEYARKAQSHTEALMAMIERIADLSLLASGRFRLESTPFDLRREAEAACAGKADAAQAKGIRFAADFPPHLPVLTGDPARTRRLMCCLIDTVLHAAAPGDVSVALDTDCDAPGRCGIVLNIKAHALSETGKALLSTLQQNGTPDAAAVSPSGGTAIAATLCAQLAGQLNARITMETDVQNAAQLYCRLELPTAAHPLSHLRALLIAERATEWLMRFSAFTGQGIRIDTAESAMDGLVALKQAATEQLPYRIVMLGARVQGMDATILSTAIKGDVHAGDATLALLSEQETVDEAALARAGFSALISKDAPAESVLRVLEQLWSGVAQGSSLSFVSATHSDSPSLATAVMPSPAVKRRVLIADDNPINREVAARMLEKFGFECALAGDGREAVDMHLSLPYDMILMDCEMPGMDGYQATRLIRSLAAPSPRTPVLALTASTAQGDREKCLAAGMDDFLAKPIRPQVLSDILSRWFPASAQAVPEPASAPLEDELESIHAMFGADFAELAHLYQRDTPARIASLHRAFVDRDCGLIAKVAHALGGSSASIGATGLSGLCKAMEARAKAGVLDEFEKTISNIENEYRRISGRLQSLIG